MMGPKLDKNFFDSLVYQEIPFSFKFELEKDRMPAKKKNGEYNYIINEKVCVVYWKDGSKTIVRKTSDDEHNPRIAFLTAYFQKYSGLSKNKANKFLASLKEEEPKD